MAGSLRLTREQLAIITGGDPRAIRAFEDFFAALNDLGAHAATHEPGGADPLTVDAAAAIGSLRTIGAGAAQACAGNDTRLSDARTPTAHASSHEPGGADPVTIGLREVANPSVDWLDSKSTFTADRFAEADGGFELDFSADPSYVLGARFALVYIEILTAAGIVAARSKSNPNIGNQPFTATAERSTHILEGAASTGAQVLIPMDATGKAELAVSVATMDINVAYPMGYVL